MIGPHVFKLPIVLVAVALLIAACGPDAPGAAPTVLLDSDTVVVEQIDILILESFPVQINVRVTGKLPDACSFIDDVQQTREGNNFQVTLTLARDPLKKCELSPTPFEYTVPLDVVGLEAGTYHVTVNGITGTFDLTVDNILATPEGDMGDPSLAAFEQDLQEAIQARDYRSLQRLMGVSFVLALENAEGLTLTPEEAIDQLHTNYLGGDTNIEFHTLQDLLGEDLGAVAGPDVNLVRALYATGWGTQGDQDAILIIGELPYGGLYWHGVLISPAQPRSNQLGEARDIRSHSDVDLFVYTRAEVEPLRETSPDWYRPISSGRQI